LLNSLQRSERRFNRKSAYSPLFPSRLEAWKPEDIFSTSPPLSHAWTNFGFITPIAKCMYLTFLGFVLVWTFCGRIREGPKCCEQNLLYALLSSFNLGESASQSMSVSCRKDSMVQISYL
jgi:hypothetical protein